jgi:hypothetical protein
MLETQEPEYTPADPMLREFNVDQIDQILKEILKGLKMG